MLPIPLRSALLIGLTLCALAEETRPADLSCPQQDLQAWVAPEGVTVAARGTRFAVVPVRLGRGGDGEAIAPGAVSRVDDRLRIARGALTEEVSLSAAGLRQDWIVAAPPAGSGALELVVAFPGTRVAQVRETSVLLASGARAWTWGSLAVWDADGRPLPARFHPAAEGVAIRVDDAGARYPVTIDPTLTDADFAAIAGSTMAEIDGRVHPLVEGPDGLYVGGSFSRIGGVPAPNVARWNGSWAPVGNGLWGSVDALHFHQGTLYAAGVFSTGMGRTSLMRLVDGVWTPVFATDFFMGSIRTMASLGSSLVLGGSFTDGVLAWNGSTLSRVGTGLRTLSGMISVTRLFSFAGELWCIGVFADDAGTQLRIARFDGTRFTATGYPAGLIAEDVAIEGSTLSVLSIGSASSLSIQRFAAGSWTAFGATTAIRAGPGRLAPIPGGGLLLCGQEAATGTPTISYWTGTAWETCYTADQGVVSTLTIGSSVYLSGFFTRIGAVPASSLARIAVLQPRVTVTATDAVATETAAGAPADGGSFLLTRNPNPGFAQTVTVQIGGSAGAGSDYAPLPTSVTFPAGAATVALPVTVLDDAVGEGPETVQATLLPGVGYLVGTPAGATVTISDDDNPTLVTIVSSDPAAETAAGATADPGAFTVTRQGATTAALTVALGVGGTATAGSDYAAIAAVVIPAGASSVTVPVTVLDDGLGEGPETVALTVQAGLGYGVGSPASATVTIADDNPLRAFINFQPSNAAVPGGHLVDSGATFAARATGYSYGWNTSTTTVDRNQASSPDQRYDTLARMAATQTWEILLPNGVYRVRLVCGEAGVLSARDYRVDAEGVALVRGTPGQSAWVEGSADITVADGRLTLASAAGAVGHVLCFVEITGVVELPVVAVQAVDSVAAEPADHGLFRLTRSGPTAAALMVGLQRGGTASNGNDVTSLATSVTFAVGVATIDLPLTVRDDTLAEVGETVVLTVSPGISWQPAPGAASATVNIADDGDAQVVTITANDAIANEYGLDRATFTVRRQSALPTALTVPYTVTVGSGAATSGSDFLALSGTATIGANGTSAAITVTPVQDALVEGTETVTLTVGASTAYRTGSPASASVSILDDDGPRLASISFQPGNAAVPAGYLVDSGSAFGSRGNGFSYGWVGSSNTAAVDRNSALSPGQQWDTFIRQRNTTDRAWEIALPNGTYRVRVVSGDPATVTGRYRVLAEGTTVLCQGAQAAGAPWVDGGFVPVTIQDGRLTIATDATAVDPVLCFIEIER